MAGRSDWNHNNEYQRQLLTALPPRVDRALDVGCGQGYLLPALAARADEVIGLDVDRPSLREAATRTAGLPNVRLVEGDVFGPEVEGTFAAVLSAAVLHHLPLEAGLQRLADLVAPGGTLGVVGLARSSRLGDWAHDAVGAVETRVKRLAHRGCAPVTAPLRDPDETYAEVEAVARRLLPGVAFRRRTLFRYTLVWRRPA